MEKRLSEKVIIITGASSGIGAASARLLSSYGCKVVLAARQVDKMQAIASSLQGESLVVPTDITKAEDITTLINQTIDKFGRIDVMFANAGIYIPGEFEDGDPEAFANLMNVNINGVMRCVHAALPHMKARQSGDILVSSSISGFVDIHWEPVYSASKHAIQGFVHTLRRQVAKYGIRVGAVCPGAVANELWGIDDPVEIERLSVQERKYIQSEDVANAVAFMLSQPPHVTIRDLVMLPQKQDI